MKKKLKQGMVIVLNEDIFDDNAIILLSSSDDIIETFNLKSKTIVQYNKEEILNNLKQEKWCNRVCDEL